MQAKNTCDRINLIRTIRLLTALSFAWTVCHHAPVLFAAPGPTVTITNPPNGATFLAHAGFVLVAYTLVLGAPAFWIFHRRDVQGATGGG